jgi:hypothetical protein
MREQKNIGSYLILGAIIVVIGIMVWNVFRWGF